MEVQPERLGLKIERFAAVSDSDFQSEAQLGVERDALRPITDTEFACFLSHRNLCSRIVQTGTPCLILVDNVILSRKLPEFLSSADSLQGAEPLTLENWYTRRLLAGPARISGPLHDSVDGLCGLIPHQAERALAVQVQLMQRMGLTPPLETPTAMQHARNAPRAALTSVIKSIIKSTSVLFERVDRLLQRIVLWRRVEYRLVKMDLDDFQFQADIV